MDEKNIQRLKICTYQGYTMGFSKMCHLAQKIKEKKTRME
jgi:hypothetical protein